MIGFRKVILKSIVPVKGNQVKAVNEKEVFAKIKDLGINSKYSALTAGKEISFSAYIWKNEYNGQSHLEFDGITYKVESVASGNETKIKLLLSRY